MGFFFQVIFRFFVAGLFSVGGGMAVISFFNEMAARFGWLSEETLSTIIAIGQSMPGPIGVNMATYAGYVIFESIWGGVAAALALVFPSLVIAVLVARALVKFKENRYVQMAFHGIRPAVAALVASACMGLFLGALFRVPLFGQTGRISDLFNFLHIGIFAALLAVHYTVKIKKKPLSPIVFVVASACLGIALKL